MTDTFPAKVVECQDYSSGGYKQVVINKGSDNGVREGQTFLIYSLGDEIFDPDTKESLGRLEIVRGRGYVTHLQPKIATITSRDREEYSYEYTNTLGQLLMGSMAGKEIRKEKGDIIPFKNAEKGDLAKPI